MKKSTIGLLLMTLAASASAAATCTTIKQGVLLYSPGHYLAGLPLKVGFDAYGVNYQAHLFNGSYANNYLGEDGFPPYDGNDAAYILANPTVVGTWYWDYRTTMVNMKWNDAWLSNQDCDGDGKLDRHYGFTSYKGSGAWETNHMLDSYELNGATIHWTYFVKIVAVPGSAVLNTAQATPTSAGVWYEGSAEIGPDIWGEFATIQEVYNDPGLGAHGISYKSPTSPGFGYWGNQP